MPTTYFTIRDTIVILDEISDVLNTIFANKAMGQAEDRRQKSSMFSHYYICCPFDGNNN